MPGSQRRQQARLAGTRARTPCAGRRRAVTPAGQPQFAGVRSGLAQSKWSGRTRSEVRRVSERLFSGRSACKPRRAWTAERTPRWPRSRPRTATTASGTTGLTDSSTGSGTSPRRAGARVQPCRVVHSVGARSHRTPRGAEEGGRGATAWPHCPYRWTRTRSNWTLDMSHGQTVNVRSRPRPPRTLPWELSPRRVFDG